MPMIPEDGGLPAPSLSIPEVRAHLGRLVYELQLHMGSAPEGVTINPLVDACNHLLLASHRAQAFGEACLMARRPTVQVILLGASSLQPFQGGRGFGGQG